LEHYDYAMAGAYFVTVCVQGRRCLFGEIKDTEMRLNRFGEIVDACWDDLPRHYGRVELDAFVVMPNHVHGIVVLTDVGAGLKPARTPVGPDHGLSEIVRAFKTFSSRRINALRGSSGTPVWQRGFYEHVIRNNADLQRIRQYITDNPLRWALDPENPTAVRLTRSRRRCG
jgi:putative transposase